MSNTGVFAPHMGWCLHPIWGGVEKKFFATRTYPPYLYLTPPPTFQILEISLHITRKFRLELHHTVTPQFNGRGQNYPLTTPTPNNAHVIICIISARMPHLVKIAQGGGYFSHIAKVTTDFFITRQHTDARY